MPFYVVIGVCLVAFALSFFVTKLLIPFSIKKQIVDIPNERSMHNTIIPIGGGISIVVSLGITLFLAWFLRFQLPSWELWSGATILVITGIFEDKGRVPIKLRFPIQLLVALFITMKTGGFTQLPLPAPLNLSLGVLSIPFNVLWITGFLNLFNFMDGIDGYAASKAFIGGIIIALLSYDSPVFVVVLIIAFANLGFLIWNWQPAKIFMGETGAITLGFLFACMPYYMDTIPAYKGTILIALVFWFFLTDGAYTLLRRTLRGEKIWLPHKSHLYQRLVLSGLSNSKVVLIITFSSVLLSLFSFLCWYWEITLWYPLFVAMILFTLYLSFTISRERKTASGM